jgi:serine/threonine protein kinase
LKSSLPRAPAESGEVYRALDTRLDRTVAIKVLASHLSSSPELRLLHRNSGSARSARPGPFPRLTIRTFAVSYDIGSEDGTDYLVMEFLEDEPADITADAKPHRCDGHYPVTVMERDGTFCREQPLSVLR